MAGRYPRRVGQEAGITESEVSLRGADGAAIPCYVAEPAGATHAAGVVIAPELFGLSAWIRSCARRLAEFGFRAAAVEVFARDPLPDPERAPLPVLMERMQRLGCLGALDDPRARAAHLRARGASKTGCLGFCLGG